MYHHKSWKPLILGKNVKGDVMRHKKLCQHRFLHYCEHGLLLTAVMRHRKIKTRLL